MSKISVYPLFPWVTVPNFALASRCCWSLSFLREQFPPERKSTSSRKERKHEHANHPSAAAQAPPAGRSQANADSRRNPALICCHARGVEAATWQFAVDDHGSRRQPACRCADFSQARRPRSVESYFEWSRRRGGFEHSGGNVRVGDREARVSDQPSGSLCGWARERRGGHASSQDSQIAKGGGACRCRWICEQPGRRIAIPATRGSELLTEPSPDCHGCAAVAPRSYSVRGRRDRD